MAGKFINNDHTTHMRTQHPEPPISAGSVTGALQLGTGRIMHLVARLVLVTLGFLTATTVQAQTAPAVIEGIDAQDDRAMSEERRGAAPHTALSASGEARPKITITADRDTIYGSLEDLRMVVKREKAGEALMVTVKLRQDEKWLDNRLKLRDVYFYANDTISVLKIHRSSFNPDVTESGCIVATVKKVNGYDVSKAEALVLVISVPSPVVTLSLNRAPDTFAENEEHASQQVVARMTLGMPRGVAVAARLNTRGNESSRAELTATSGEDFEPLSETLVISEDEYRLEQGWWVARTNLSLALFDDDMREGTETFALGVNPPPDQSDKARFLNADGTKCWGRCRHLMHITDDEDIPSLDLSVSADEIMEEGETSSAAMVSTTNGKSFAADRMVTLSLGGTATMGADYKVSPADADNGSAGYQVVLPGQSSSTQVAIQAMSDNVDDPDEMIEVSAALDGDAIGDVEAIRIMNQQVVLPRITVAANRDQIIAGMEDLELTLTREGPLDKRLRVTVQLIQDQHWLSLTSCPAIFPAGEATVKLTIRRRDFSNGVFESGNLTATVNAADGYDTNHATATVLVVSQKGPAMKVLFNHDAYGFHEDRRDPFAILVAQAASGMPRGTTVRFSVVSRSGTAESGEDFKPVSEMITVREEDFAFENGLWQAQHRLPLTLLDDEVREGTESFDLNLERAPGHPDELQLSDFTGAACQGDCATAVEINDGEDIPILKLSVKPAEIREEEESSATATVAITNGKTFAADQTVTFAFAGGASQGADYRVAPADGNSQASGHQMALPAGSTSTGVTLTAQADNSHDPDEKIEISAAHDGDEIGNGVVHIVDQPLGPKVEVTFTGVRPSQDPVDDGIATGPFTTHFTFSEPVEGFTEDDVDWSTLAWTTHDSTLIGLVLSDFTEVRAGLEYSVRALPTKSGRLSVGAEEGAAFSVATGAANEWGHANLWIDLPENLLMVWPTSLTVHEEDAVGDKFTVVLTSKPTSTVSVDLSGTEDTAVKVAYSLPLTFSTSNWSVARGVTVTAGADANTADETVTLTLSASGGGYDGKTGKVVVTVRDNGAGSAGDSGGDVNDETGALIVLEDVTPEVAAAALFGQEGLSEAQLAALDHLGNGNGSYDLGDLLSWVARCRQGKASCGRTSSPGATSIPGAAAALAAAGHGGRTSRRQRRGSPSGAREHLGQRQQRNGRRSRRADHRRPRAGWHGLVLLLAATMTWACVDDSVVTPAEPDPGYLTVQLKTLSAARAIGAMLVVEGPGIDAVRAPGFELFQSDASSSTRREIIVSGALYGGPVLDFRVPDRGNQAAYRVRLLQVSGEDYSLRNLSAYSAVISR